MASERFDKIILGAGLYGLYSALFCCERGQNILVLECDPAPFQRATYVNQARVHQGYHYPRSISTAMKTAGFSHIVAVSGMHVAFLVTALSVAASAGLLYLIDRKILRKAGLSAEQAKKSALRLALITAPYLYFFPSELLYGGL